MAKLWENKLHKPLSAAADAFNSSIAFDSRMVEDDVAGSTAHAKMLGATGIISAEAAENIVTGLECILSDVKSGKLTIDASAEDIHTFIENELTSRIGNDGKKLHTARSRNDQVALDLRLNLLKENAEIKKLLVGLLSAIEKKASENVYTIMAGYTHLQQAQPISFAHYLLAYAEMFKRDVERLDDLKKRTLVSPLGSCALAGTPFPIDRELTAKLLGMQGASANSIDGVSDRDFAIEFLSASALIMMHLSRFSEELIIWSSQEFKYVTFGDAQSTGSSIMPQKKNPDVAELIRGKTGRTYGNLMALLTVMKGLPLAYNKDMQEDKEAVFDSVDTVKACLVNFADMLTDITVNADNMLKSAYKGFINATDVADYLTKKGLPFRDAYAVSGNLVALCVQKGFTLNNAPFELYQNASALFEKDIYDAVDLTRSAEKRTSYGGAASSEVTKQLEALKAFCQNAKI